MSTKLSKTNRSREKCIIGGLQRKRELTATPPQAPSFQAAHPKAPIEEPEKLPKAHQSRQPTKAVEVLDAEDSQQYGERAEAQKTQFSNVAEGSRPSIAAQDG